MFTGQYLTKLKPFNQPQQIINAKEIQLLVGFTSPKILFAPPPAAGQISNTFYCRVKIQPKKNLITSFTASTTPVTKFLKARYILKEASQMAFPKLMKSLTAATMAAILIRVI